MSKSAELKKETQGATRPPIVVVMGHIDHGKTTLLDTIRKSRIAEREAGGITQAIGAYQVEHNGKKITFIDTPGHEAFSSMRGRGAHVADIAALVVAADEGIKPQTEEAIRIIRENELPFVVAINKIDKPNSDPNRVKTELAEKEILVEGFGGTVPVAELSAKSGEGIEGLLETILLLAELEELKTDLSRPGTGVVIESHLDSRSGAAATLLIEDGSVHRGDFIVIADQAAPVRRIENFLGKSVDAASASEPIRITGFQAVPKLGETFAVFKTKAEAEARRTPQASSAPAAGAPSAKTLVNIILKTDVLGSKEVIEGLLAKINSPEIGNRILKSEAGDINESDVKLASGAHTLVVGFKVKISPAVKELAERNGAAIVMSEIIYELVDAVKAGMIAMAPAEIKRRALGKAKILARFKEEGKKQIVGGKVEEGAIEKGAHFEIIRNKMKIGAGKIAGLQQGRQNADAVSEGQEFGMLADADIALAAGDTLEAFVEERVTPTL